MLPSIRDAAKDNELTVSSYRLLIFLTTILDVEQDRPVKQTWLAQELQLSERVVRKSLDQLLQRGYLREAKPVAGAPRQYRLAYSRSTST